MQLIVCMASSLAGAVVSAIGRKRKSLGLLMIGSFLSGLGLGLCVSNLLLILGQVS